MLFVAYDQTLQPATTTSRRADPSCVVNYRIGGPDAGSILEQPQLHVVGGHGLAASVVLRGLEKVAIAGAVSALRYVPDRRAEQPSGVGPDVIRKRQGAARDRPHDALVVDQATALPSRDACEIEQFREGGWPHADWMAVRIRQRGERLANPACWQRFRTGGCQKRAERLCLIEDARKPPPARKPPAGIAPDHRRMNPGRMGPAEDRLDVAPGEDVVRARVKAGAVGRLEYHREGLLETGGCGVTAPVLDINWGPVSPEMCRYSHGSP